MVQKYGGKELCWDLEYDAHDKKIRSNEERNIPIEKKKEEEEKNIPILMIWDIKRNIWKNTVLKGILLDFLKVTNVIPVHKKGEKLDSNNYRPISFLFNKSKLYEN